MALRQWAGLGVLLCAVILLAVFANHHSLSKDQYTTCCILIVVVIAWVTEIAPIPITSMLIGPMFYLGQVCSLKDALGSYTTNLTMLLFGSYFIAIAMERHGLDQRFANFVTGLRIVGDEPWRLRLALMFSGALMSMWVSNTAATNILIPILLKTMNAERNVPLSNPDDANTLTGSLLSLAYACNAGGMGTLVGTPPNLVASRFLEEKGVEVGFLKWMVIGVPASVVIAAVCGVLLNFMYPSLKKKKKEAGEQSPSTSKTSKKMTWGEKVTLACFLFTVFLWLFADLYRLAGGQGHETVKKMMPAGVMVLFGTLPMFVIPDTDRRTRVLPLSSAKQADWGIVMLIGGGVILGKEIIATGLGKLIAQKALEATGVNDIWTLTFLVVFCTIFATEITSNTATTNVLVPIVYSACEIIDPNPAAAVPAVLGVAIAASCAFMMPIATPPNYLVKDTGHVQFGDMMKAGLGINLISSVAVWLLLRAIVPIAWPSN